MNTTTQSNFNWHLNTWLIISLIILNILDFETTRVAIEQHGYGEAYPILDYLMAKTDTVWSILWFKTAIIGILLIIPYIFIEKFREACQTKRMEWVFGILNVIYLVVVISNINIIT